MYLYVVPITYFFQIDVKIKDEEHKKSKKEDGDKGVGDIEAYNDNKPIALCGINIYIWIFFQTDVKIKDEEHKKSKKEDGDKDIGNIEAGNDEEQDGSKVEAEKEAIKEAEQEAKKDRDEAKNLLDELKVGLMISACIPLGANRFYFLNIMSESGHFIKIENWNTFNLTIYVEFIIKGMYTLKTK